MTKSASKGLLILKVNGSGTPAWLDLDQQRVLGRSQGSQWVKGDLGHRVGGLDKVVLGHDREHGHFSFQKSKSHANAVPWTGSERQKGVAEK